MYYYSMLQICKVWATKTVLFSRCYKSILYCERYFLAA